LGAIALRAFSGLPFWACLAIALFGLLVNGWLATWEDEQSGGFSNRTDKRPSNLRHHKREGTMSVIWKTMAGSVLVGLIVGFFRENYWQTVLLTLIIGVTSGVGLAVLVRNGVFGNRKNDKGKP